MKIQLTNEEKQDYFHRALCNGLSYIDGHGLELFYNKEDYAKAKSVLSAPCYEDVLMQILRDGKQLMLRDHEGSEDDAYITMEQMYQNIEKVEPQWLMQMYEEGDDAETADVILQTVFLGEHIYG